MLAGRKSRVLGVHLVEGLLIAILDIDEVIQLIRTSDDTAAARERLMTVFDLSHEQATYILDKIAASIKALGGKLQDVEAATTELLKLWLGRSLLGVPLL